MRFVAPEYAALGMLLCAAAARADSVAQCPTPPGGQVVCESSQWAVCEVKDGKVVARCFSFAGATQFELLGSIVGDPARVRRLSDKQVKSYLTIRAFEFEGKKIAYTPPSAPEMQVYPAEPSEPPVASEAPPR